MNKQNSCNISFSKREEIYKLEKFLIKNGFKYLLKYSSPSSQRRIERLLYLMENYDFGVSSYKNYLKIKKSGYSYGQSKYYEDIKDMVRLSIYNELLQQSKGA